jgi:hypothetical protein
MNGWIRDNSIHVPLLPKTDYPGTVSEVRCLYRPARSFALASAVAKTKVARAVGVPYSNCFSLPEQSSLSSLVEPNLSKPPSHFLISFLLFFFFPSH